ncbi:MAG: cytochrome c maturation protein CcmE [Anaerolineae bacterium]|nr:cytochrome c maturation protein CcmE [Anaerolineae bacterium]
MAQATWEKSRITDSESPTNKFERLKFIIAGAVLLVAVAYLILSGTATGARYFITVDEIVSNPAYVGQTVRISGAVLGDSIQYDSSDLLLDFTIVNIPPEFENLEQTLHQAVNDSTVSRLAVHIENEVKPDMLKHEAQAILTGTMGEDGVFYATELLLKCPSHYEESLPDQVVDSQA